MLNIMSTSGGVVLETSHLEKTLMKHQKCKPKNTSNNQVQEKSCQESKRKGTHTHTHLKYYYDYDSDSDDDDINYYYYYSY